MKTFIVSFKNSIENDMTSHAENLSFLDEYKIESIEFDSNNIRIYKLSSNKGVCLLEVINKKSDTSHQQNVWETENYKYHILVKNE